MKPEITKRVAKTKKVSFSISLKIRRFAMKIGLDKNTLLMIKDLPEGVCVVSEAMAFGEVLPAFYIVENKAVVKRLRSKKGRCRSFVGIVAIREDDVTVVFFYLQFADIPGMMYEATLDPANSHMRKIIEGMIQKKKVLNVFLGRGGKGKFAISMIDFSYCEPSLKKILKNTKEGEWTREDFIRVKDNLLRKYSTEALASLALQQIGTHN